MTDYYASANGQRIVSCSFSEPWYGAPTCEVILATDAPLVDPVTVTIGNRVARMAVLQQAPFAGATRALLTGGAARWGTEVQLTPYENPAGVTLSTVLGDLAKATRKDPANASTGETVALASDRSLGTLYVPERGPAARLLRELAGELWWVDSAGVTQVGPRATKAIRSQATVGERHGESALLDVATEDPAAWVPGATFAGATVAERITVAFVRLTVRDEKLRVQILTTGMTAPSNGPTTQDRALAAFRALVRAEDPRRTYQHLYEYTVASADGSTFDGLPVDPGVAPQLPRRVPYRPSLAGSTCIPKAGALALVAFINGDPARPVCLGFDATAPITLTITGDEIDMGPALAPAARYGDAVAIDPITGVLSFVPSLSRPNPSTVKV